MSEGATGSSRMAEFAGMPYRKLVRAIDDPELNFQKIRSHALWLKHDFDKEVRRQQELHEALKAQAQNDFAGNELRSAGRS